MGCSGSHLPRLLSQVAQLVVTGGNGVARRSVAAVVLGGSVGQPVLLVIAKVLLLTHRVIADSTDILYVVITILLLAHFKDFN